MTPWVAADAEVIAVTLPYLFLDVFAAPALGRRAFEDSAAALLLLLACRCRSPEDADRADDAITWPTLAARAEPAASVITYFPDQVLFR